MTVPRDARPRATRRAARPRVALAPMLARRGDDAALATIDDRFLLSTLPDGWRCLLLLDDRVRVRSRSGADLAPRLPALVAPLEALRASVRGLSVLDAVLTVPPAAHDDAWPGLAAVTSLAVLDVLCIGGRDVTARPLRERLEHLRTLRLRDAGPLHVIAAHRGDARATLAQLGAGGSTAAGALLVRRGAARYRPGVRSADWRTFGGRSYAEMLLCGIATSGALVLGRCSPFGVVPGGATWPTRRWRALAERCREGPPAFSSDGLWPSLGAVTWARPEVWLAVEADVRAGSGRSGPRWRVMRVQEDLSLPATDPRGGFDAAGDLA
jgi:hypothetical protein